MRTSSENEEVLCVLLGRPGDPSLWNEGFRVFVGLGVMGSRPDGWDNHGALGKSVRRGDWEVLLDFIGNHDDWRAVSEGLFYDSTGIGELVEQFHGGGCVAITVPDLEVLIADLVEDVGAIGHDLEEPGTGAAGCVLRGKEEGENGLCNLIIRKITEDVLWLLGVRHRDTLGDLFTVGGGVEHGLDPAVHDAGDLVASSHADLALCRTLAELSQDHVSCLLSVPGLGEGKDDGEIDELESGGDEVVVVGNLDHGLVGHVVAHEGLAGESTHELSELRHPGDWLVVVVGGLLDEHAKVPVVDAVEQGHVDAQCLSGEEAVEALAVLDMVLAIEEDPVGLAEQLVSRVDDAGLDVHGRVEHFAGHVTGRCDHDEPA